jgi:hypothetical protein
MAVTSDSTDAEVMDEIEDNADYDLGSSESSGITKAKLFIHAARIRIWRLKSQVSKGDKQLANDLRMLQVEIKDALQYLRGTSNTPGLVTHPDLSEFR